MTEIHTMSPIDLPPIEVRDGYSRFFGRYWSPLLRESDLIDGQPTSARLLDHALVVARLNGSIVVMDDLCRHFQAALSLGSVEQASCGRQVLRCKYHGWAFNNTGQCVEIPQLDEERRIPGDARVKTYPVQVKHGVVWVKLEESEAADVPEIPAAKEESLHVLPMQVTKWECSAIRMVLSALDDYHFAFLHEGVLGNRSRPQAPSRTINRYNTSLVSEFSVVQPANITNSPAGYAKAEASVDYTMKVDIPNVISLIKRNPLGTYVVWFATSPRSIRHTDVFWTVARSYDLEPDSDERVIKQESMIQGQDQPIVASQRPWVQTALPIRDVDDALVAYLKWLNELGCPTAV